MLLHSELPAYWNYSHYGVCGRSWSDRQIDSSASRNWLFELLHRILAAGFHSDNRCRSDHNGALNCFRLPSLVIFPPLEKRLNPHGNQHCISLFYVHFRPSLRASLPAIWICRRLDHTNLVRKRRSTAWIQNYTHWNDFGSIDQCCAKFLLELPDLKIAVSTSKRRQKSWCDLWWIQERIDW